MLKTLFLYLLSVIKGKNLLFEILRAFFKKKSFLIFFSKNEKGSYNIFLLIFILCNRFQSCIKSFSSFLEIFFFAIYGKHKVDKKKYAIS